MALVELEGIEIGFGGSPVLRGANLTINEGSKAGLIGANGAGKTTLLGVVRGIITPEGGVARMERGRRVAYVAQHFDSQLRGSALEFVTDRMLAWRRRLRALEASMGELEGSHLSSVLEEYGTLRERYDREDGDRAEERGRAMLARVGLGKVADREVHSLSGGEKNRLQIARALMDRPDLLILDEPGNHLDAWGLAWLEELLREYPAAVLVVSHNRYLLDRVVSTIFELREGRVTAWSGNYSDFRRAKLMQAVATAQQARADEKHLARLETMVQRLATLARSKPDPKLGQQLKARRTQLARARQEARKRPNVSESTAVIRFDRSNVRADIALEINGLDLRAGDEKGPELLTDANALIHAGDRTALVGPNGCGKTTLLRRIVAEGSWENPQIRIGPSMRVGYCAQQQELFDPEITLQDTLARLRPLSRDQIFNLLSRYRFAYADLDRKVGTLSGGELNRLQLARAEIMEANVLILDEPTNHLDIPSREVVEEALLRFRGTLLIVSHDRYFLDTIADRVLYFDQGELRSFPGGFSEYWQEVGRFQGTRADQGRRRETPQAPAETREDDLEGRLLSLESEKIEVERRLTAAYEKGALKEAARLSERLAKISRMYDRLYARWG